jgi:hypothetical protein
MRVYKIEYREYEYRPGVYGGGMCYSDYFLTNTNEKHVIADNSLNAVDLLRDSLRSKIEVVSIEHVCKVDHIKK